MKRAAFLAVLVSLLPQSGLAQQEIVLDRYMSPAAGTTDLLTIQRELATVEDRVLPLTLSDERGRLSLLAGIFYRTGKFVGLDVPQDHMLLVVGHEVFGHGARLRELGVGRIAYSFAGPLPYGGGGAVTSFRGDFPDTPLASLAVEMAGIEAQNTMADSIAAAALARGRIHYREAWLYFETRYLGMTYMLDATEDSEEGHDVGDFFRTFKKACTRPDCHPITLRDLRRGARLTLADPLLYFSLYGFASSYVAQGNASSAIPMIPIGRGIRYLPSVGFQMTPYGTERLLRNAFVSGEKAEPPSLGGSSSAPSYGEPRSSAAAPRGGGLTTVTLRIGTTGASTPWAVDIRAADVRVFRGLHVRAAGDIWRQPPVLADQTFAPLQTGASAAATMVLPLRKLIHTDWLTAVVTGGYKTEGFVPGEQLGSGLVWRIGVVVAN